MITVYVPPWDVLQDMFPESDKRCIMNGEIIKGHPDTLKLWCTDLESWINESRLVEFTEAKQAHVLLCGDSGYSLYKVFVEWLVKLDWRPYGEHKILQRRRGPHVDSHSPDL